MAERDIQRVTPKRGKRIIHVEVPLGIINIYLDLHDMAGRDVITISVSPDDYAGEPPVRAVGNDGGVRLIKGEGGSPTDEHRQAMADWRSGRAFVRPDGNYRLRRVDATNRRASTAAPWNAAAKRRWPTCDELHKEASR